MKFNNIIFKIFFWSPTILLTKKSYNSFGDSLGESDATIKKAISKKKSTFR